MTIQEFKDQHLTLYRDQYKEGFVNKLLALFILVLALIFAYNLCFNGHDQGAKKLSETYRILIVISVGLFFTASLIFSDPLYFVFPIKVWSAKRKYKIDLFEIIKSITPEIVKYSPGKKISPIEFFNSGLFNERFEDYSGDDWMEFSYNNNLFIACDLKVTRLFKNIFQGLFVTYYSCNKEADFLIRFDPSDNNSTGSDALSKSSSNLINSYCKTNNSMVIISQKKCSLYIAIERNKNIFERTNLKTINSLENEIEIFKTNIQIVRSIIDDLS